MVAATESHVQPGYRSGAARHPATSAGHDMTAGSTPELVVQVPALQEQNRRLHHELAQAARREATLAQHLAHSRSTASDLVARLELAEERQRATRRAAKEALAGLAHENAQLVAGYGEKQAALKRLQASCQEDQAAWQLRLRSMEQQLAFNQQHILQLSMLVERLTRQPITSTSSRRAAGAATGMCDDIGTAVHVAVAERKDEPSPFPGVNGSRGSSTRAGSTGVSSSSGGRSSSGMGESQTSAAAASSSSRSGRTSSASKGHSEQSRGVLGDATNTASTSSRQGEDTAKQPQQQHQQQQQQRQRAAAVAHDGSIGGAFRMSTPTSTPASAECSSDGSASSCPVTPSTSYQSASTAHADSTAESTAAASQPERSQASSASSSAAAPGSMPGHTSSTPSSSKSCQSNGHMRTQCGQSECSDAAPKHSEGQSDVLRERAARMQQAQRLKQAGNASYSSGAYKAAYRAWTQALQLKVEDAPFNAVLYCNRAAALHSLGHYLDAVADCYIAAHLDPRYPRILQRRAEALTAVGDHAAAAADLQTLSALSPGSHSIQQRLRQVQAHIKAGEGPNHYVVLGLSSSCEAAEVKVAYKRLALKYHPDKAPNSAHRAASEALFRLISAANTVLSDPAQRRKFDAARQQRRLQRSAGGACYGFAAVYTGGGPYAWRAASRG